MKKLLIIGSLTVLLMNMAGCAVYSAAVAVKDTLDIAKNVNGAKETHSAFKTNRGVLKDYKTVYFSQDYLDKDLVTSTVADLNGDLKLIDGKTTSGSFPHFVEGTGDGFMDERSVKLVMREHKSDGFISGAVDTVASIGLQKHYELVATDKNGKVIVTQRVEFDFGSDDDHKATLRSALSSLIFPKSSDLKQPAVNAESKG